MNTEIVKRFKNEFLVLLHSAYTFDDWFWFPEMTPEILEKWWANQKDYNEYFLDPRRLPGRVIPASNLDEETLYLKLRLSGEYYKADIDSPLEAVLHNPYTMQQDYQKSDTAA